MSNKIIALISSHPIQYNAPFFRALSTIPEIDLIVFDTWGVDGAKSKFDPDFNQQINWNIPHLEGYVYQFFENKSKHTCSDHFHCIKNPSLINQIQKLNACIIWGWCWAFQSHLNFLRQFKGKTKIQFRGDSTLLDDKPGFSIKQMSRKVFLKWGYSHRDKAYFLGAHNKKYFFKISGLIQFFHYLKKFTFLSIPKEHFLVL